LPRQGFCRTLDEVFAGSCLIATRYRDPFGNRPASFEDTLALLAEWRRIELANRRVAVCVGMSFWKRRRVADFLRSTAGTPAFRRTAAGAVATARLESATEPRAIAVWASRMPPGLAEMAGRHRVPLIRVEDGFVRSVGLGADFLPPASLVFDGGGMYYDPRSRSDLESLLAGAEFAPALIERADRLMAQLVARGVTKYNLAGQVPILDMPAGVRRIRCPARSRTISRCCSAAARFAATSPCLNRSGPPIPTPSSSTSRIPMSSPGIARGLFPTRWPGALPMRSCRTYRPRHCSPASTKCIR
jgi:capsular polysaccharide export protein